MKKTKSIVFLISILSSTFLLYGCNNPKAIDNSMSNNSPTKSLKNKTINNNDFITEDGIWNDATTIAKDITESYGNNTIEGLKVVSDKAKENAENTTKSIDDNLLKTTEPKIRKSYKEDNSVQGLYKILYVDAFIKDKLFADYLNEAKKTDNDQEREQIFNNYKEISTPYDDLYSPIVQLLRKEDAKNKF